MKDFSYLILTGNPRSVKSSRCFDLILSEFSAGRTPEKISVNRCHNRKIFVYNNE